MEPFQSHVESLMQNNRRRLLGYQYTLPSPELYPFQWLWDSCFHAIILSHFDIKAAKAELCSVLAKPLATGLLPHIIYWQHATTKQNWGREMRGDIITDAWGVEGSSAITQPPILAYTLWRLHEQEPDKSLLERLYPILHKHFEYLAADRTFNGDSLLYIINPDESGEDNSPRFDVAQGLLPVHTADQNLEKRIDRMRQNALCSFNAKTCMSKNFGVADVPFNVLYAEDLKFMAKIATEVGDTASAETFSVRRDTVIDDMKRLMKDGALFHSLDHISGKKIDVLTWAIFMPLYGELLSSAEADTLINEYYLKPDIFYTPNLMPTTAKSESSYDPETGFWRGPIWIGANWFVYKGLKNYGYTDLAEELKNSSLKLVEKSGFREQYNPDTGEGEGASQFTWGGLIIDMN